MKRGGGSPSHEPCAVDLVCLSVIERRVHVLLRGGDRRSLPSAGWNGRGSLEVAARSLFTRVVSAAPRWCAQVGAETRGTHAAGYDISVAFVAGISTSVASPPETEWHPATALPRNVSARSRREVSAALEFLRDRVGHPPLIFSLLPRRFTLGEVQQVYEALLGRAVYAASFRRALLGSGLIVPDAAWRADQRGRPARWYRESPRARRSHARGVRFS